MFFIFYIYLFCFTSHHLNAFRLAIATDSHLCKIQKLIFLIVLCTYLALLDYTHLSRFEASTSKCFKRCDKCHKLRQNSYAPGRFFLSILILDITMLPFAL
jgi:hypothetical protein